MRAHLVQLDIAWEDPRANYDRVRALVQGALPAPGDLVVLPELFDTGFSMRTQVNADTEGHTLGFLSQLARDARLFVQGARTGAPGPDGRALNLAPVMGPDGSLIVEYAKVHPFSLGLEHERFRGGERVLTYRWGEGAEGITACPLICYDLRFPELFRRGLRAGAGLFAVEANWPEARQAHWRALLVARAIENQAFVLGVNRAGRDPNLGYVGGSIALAPRGDVLGELGPGEGVLSVDIDARALREWRGAFPAWRDVRFG